MVLICSGSRFASSICQRIVLTRAKEFRQLKGRYQREICMSTAWDIVEPTDNGILEGLNKKVIRDGEKRLMLAMLESATEDFQKYALANDRRGIELFEAAEEWILATDNPSFFSFENICAHLELDPGYMRKGYLRWITAKRDGALKECAKKPSPQAA
jgi:hypothetical protein